jgi:hypothetical protein
MTHPSWFLARFGASRPLLPSRGRTLVLLAGVVGSMAWGTAGLRAQEVEVPFDDAGRVLVINADLAGQAKAQEPESPVQLSLNPLALGALLAGAGGPIPLGAMSIRFE